MKIIKWLLCFLRIRQRPIKLTATILTPDPEFYKAVEGFRDKLLGENKQLKAEIAMLKGRTLSGEIDFGPTEGAIKRNQVIREAEKEGWLNKEPERNSFPDMVEGKPYNVKLDRFPTDENKDLRVGLPGDLTKRGATKHKVTMPGSKESYEF